MATMMVLVEVEAMMQRTPFQYHTGICMPILHNKLQTPKPNLEFKSVAAVVQRTAFDVDFVVWLTNEDGGWGERGGVKRKHGEANVRVGEGIG